MSKDKVNTIAEARQYAKIRFEAGFQNATTLQELLTAYATYCGTLNGLLDLVEIEEQQKLLTKHYLNASYGKAYSDTDSIKSSESEDI